eukprot:scaffold3491_cov73-Cylindrotheca_fusiformis.AAC.2
MAVKSEFLASSTQPPSPSPLSPPFLLLGAITQENNKLWLLLGIFVVVSFAMIAYVRFHVIPSQQRHEQKNK